MITEDRDIYFNEYLCSHAATVSDIDGYVYGYYGNEYLEVDTGHGVIDGYQPVFTCSALIAEGIERGAALSVAGDTFIVQYVMATDSIEAKLILVEA